MRYDNGGWRVADTPVVLWRSSEGWKIVVQSYFARRAGGRDQVFAWIERHGLRDATLATRVEAARTVLAFAAGDPLPAVDAASMIRRGAGHHSTPDGRWHARKDVYRPNMWALYDMEKGTDAEAQFFALVRTLQQAREAIARRLAGGY